ncbi:hypothetical protein CWB89_02725 [Pseudoalteromonas piscicida]|uniref:Uncharacterized protein n=1 Tax=Pseudoalteromonas piscicida TaxID=43662 RepID=A0AAQ2EVD1_PSEO7|nr:MULTISPECIES: hypothetical protein [Pseudoalteromonas]KJY87860.1 hypothetical protein TW75_13085 [Pseudoalteromonas piscicida]MDP4487936.1 hypothetical protein [Pseudoalteromonas piscicida]TMN44459.1 hypothetical protein CWB94_00880 [Pseudoalteromonas piscicida]TMN44903.1 hypothetical protein CWB95_02730 [Pseudoalteromonas piscicida]TMN51265.1 hypothetical protein CWB91_13410 [Pseudoalteromonas piscicida]
MKEDEGLPDKSGKSWPYVYKATLEFLGKLAAPAVVLVIAWQFHSDISDALKNQKIRKLETIWGSAEFEEIQKIVKTVKNAPPESKEEADAIRNVEVKEEVVRAELDAGLRMEIPTSGQPKAENEEINAPPTPQNWEVVLGISWVKPNDLFGRTYFLSVEGKMNVWPVEIDEQNKRTLFLINSSTKSRDSGTQYLKPTWVVEGESAKFEGPDKAHYRLVLVDIRNAGKIPSKAAYIQVEKLNGA